MAGLRGSEIRTRLQRKVRVFSNMRFIYLVAEPLILRSLIPFQPVMQFIDGAFAYPQWVGTPVEVKTAKELILGEGG